MAQTRPLDGFIKSVRYRQKHFRRKRRFAQQFHDQREYDIADKLRACQETELLACCSNCGKAWWVLNRCRQRVCPLCSFEVSKQRATFLKALTSKMQFPKMLTLTMPLWHGDPHEGIKHLRQAFAGLRRTKIFKPVKGGAYQIELKIKPGAFHIHMHILLDAPFLPYQKLFTTWKSILHTDCPQIDIRSAESEKAREYICKYAAKSADFDAHLETILDWYLATKGERLFATFGEWYNVKIEELDPDSPLILPERVCPNCKAVKTVFLARDGPFVYGEKTWSLLAKFYAPDYEVDREIVGVKNAIETPLTNEEKESYKWTNKNDKSDKNTSGNQLQFLLSSTLASCEVSA